MRSGEGELCNESFKEKKTGKWDGGTLFGWSEGPCKQVTLSQGLNNKEQFREYLREGHSRQREKVYREE